MTGPGASQAPVGDLFDKHGRFFTAGTVLFREGEVGREMYVIHTGTVRLTRHLRNREAVLAILPAGEFFGEMAIVNNRPRSATATVVEDAWLLVIGPRTFEAMIRSKAEIAVRLIKTLAARLEQAMQQIDLLLVKDANHRLVRALRQLAERQGASQGVDVFIPMSVQNLAGLVALDEEQVADSLARLHDARLVVPAQEAGYEGEGYLVPEVGRLAEFLEFLEIKERFGG